MSANNLRIFTNATIDSQIQAIVRENQAATAPATAPPTGGGVATPGNRVSPNSGRDTQTHSGTPAPACVLAAAKRPDAPVVQTVGQYLGVQVFALVYPSDTDPAHQWDVFLVQNSCSAPLVLLQRSVPHT
jgi:hypothetical protein